VHHASSQQQQACERGYICSAQGRMEMRVYRPTAPGVRAAMLYITGGAYIACNLDERDFVCANLARAGFCVCRYRSIAKRMGLLATDIQRSHVLHFIPHKWFYRPL
jgi:hypothetical protein